MKVLTSKKGVFMYLLALLMLLAVVIMPLATTHSNLIASAEATDPSGYSDEYIQEGLEKARGDSEDTYLALPEKLGMWDPSASPTRLKESATEAEYVSISKTAIAQKAAKAIRKKYIELLHDDDSFLLNMPGDVPNYIQFGRGGQIYQPIYPSKNYPATNGYHDPAHPNYIMYNLGDDKAYYTYARMSVVMNHTNWMDSLVGDPVRIGDKPESNGQSNVYFTNSAGGTCYFTLTASNVDAVADSETGIIPYYTIGGNGKIDQGTSYNIDGAKKDISWGFAAVHSLDFLSGTRLLGTDDKTIRAAGLISAESWASNLGFSAVDIMGQISLAGKAASNYFGYRSHIPSSSNDENVANFVRFDAALQAYYVQSTPTVSTDATRLAVGAIASLPAEDIIFNNGNINSKIIFNSKTKSGHFVAGAIGKEYINLADIATWGLPKSNMFNADGEVGKSVVATEEEAIYQNFDKGYAVFDGTTVSFVADKYVDEDSLQINDVVYVDFELEGETVSKYSDEDLQVVSLFAGIDNDDERIKIEYSNDAIAEFDGEKFTFNSIGSTKVTVFYDANDNDIMDKYETSFIFNLEVKSRVYPTTIEFKQAKYIIPATGVRTTNKVFSIDDIIFTNSNGDEVYAKEIVFSIKDAEASDIELDGNSLKIKDEVASSVARGTLVAKAVKNFDGEYTDDVETEIILIPADIGVLGVGGVSDVDTTVFYDKSQDSKDIVNNLIRQKYIELFESGLELSHPYQAGHIGDSSKMLTNEVKKRGNNAITQEFMETNVDKQYYMNSANNNTERPRVYIAVVSFDTIQNAKAVYINNYVMKVLNVMGNGSGPYNFDDTMAWGVPLDDVFFHEETGKYYQNFTKGYVVYENKDSLPTEANNWVAEYNFDATKGRPVMPNGDEVALESVTIVASEQVEYLFVGDTLALDATFNPDFYYNPVATWSSSDESIATVSVEGLVTAVGEGRVTITLTGDNSKTDTFTIDIIPQLTAISIDDEDDSIVNGETLDLSEAVSFTPSNEGYAEYYLALIEWSSSDEAVATVDENGLVTAKKVGTATITAKYGSVEGTIDITVTRPNATAIEFENEPTSGMVGGEHTLSIKFTPELSETTDIEWTSNNESVATVDSSGKITFLTAGTVKITATVDGISITTGDITVVATIESITLNKTVNTIQKDATLDLGKDISFTPVGNNAYFKPLVVWTSSDETIATVNSNGVVTAKKVGSVTISATIGEKSDSINIIVSRPSVVTILFETEPGTGFVGEQFDLTILFNPVDSETTITFTSSDTTLATVDSNGKISYLKVGTVTITATSDGKSAETEIIISLRPVTSLTITGGQDELNVGSDLQLGIVFDPVNSECPVTWSTSNAAVATVDAATGKVTGVSAGMVTITASAGGKSKTITIEIVDESNNNNNDDDDDDDVITTGCGTIATTNSTNGGASAIIFMSAITSIAAILFVKKKRNALNN